MKYDSIKHHRRSIRLKGFDYSSPGAYFVTIRTQKFICFFGETLNGEMYLNTAGLMVGRVWNELRGRFPNVITGEYIVMPDHFHGIIIITNCDGQNDLVGDMVGPGEHKVRPCDVCDVYNTGCHAVYPCAQQTDNGRTITECGLHLSPIASTGGGDSCSYKGDPCDRPSEANGTMDGSLGRIIQAFKSITTHEYIIGVKENNWPPFPGKLWQRNYYERIIRNQKAFDRIRQYIINNPIALKKS